MIATSPYKELAEVLKKLLETIDTAEDPNEESKILFEMLKNALINELLGDFIDALPSSGKSMNDVLRSVIIDHSRQLLEQLVRAWVTLKRQVQELLEAVFAVLQEALDEVCRFIMEMVARHMTAAEITTAQLIYGNTFDFNTIYFSKDNTYNDVIFGVQDFFTRQPDSRAFVTFKLVNYDVDDFQFNNGQLDNRTLIHELCHVWQYQQVGSAYLIQAICAHATLDDAYNYGYRNYLTGDGGDTALQATITSNPGLSIAEVFGLFNREQQATIIEHYYYRKHEANPRLSVAAWQPFKDLVFSP